MATPRLRRSSLFWAALLALAAGLAWVAPARADVAPPGYASGTDPLPGGTPTQVRMLAETVTLNVLPGSPPGIQAQARTVAAFTLRNLGAQTEAMEVHFPLHETALRYGPPQDEIADLTARVNGQPVATRRVSQPPAGGSEAELIPWAAFPVTFPPETDVQIEVSYTARATGENSLAGFSYILETGAGWAGTIGSADLVVRLPYEANEQNVLMGHSGFSETTPGGAFSGNEARWHFADLEPGPEDNFEVALVVPSAWQAVLDERQATAYYPGDGEAWGRLGKACKEIIRLRRGLRTDPGGQALYQEAARAYANAVALLPEDALWHYGYAELLWNHYFWDTSFGPAPDYSLLEQALYELNISLALTPNDARVPELAQWMAYSLPGMVRQEPGGALTLIATATPWATLTPLPSPTPTLEPSITPTRRPPTVTPPPAPTPSPKPALPTATQDPATQAPVDAPQAKPGLALPVCGSALVLPLAVVAVWVKGRRR